MDNKIPANLKDALEDVLVGMKPPLLIIQGMEDACQEIRGPSGKKTILRPEYRTPLLAAIEAFQTNNNARILLTSKKRFELEGMSGRFFWYSTSHSNSPLQPKTTSTVRPEG